MSVTEIFLATQARAAGGDTQLQYNSAGAVGASPALTFTGGTLTLQPSSGSAFIQAQSSDGSPSGFNLTTDGLNSFYTDGVGTDYLQSPNNLILQTLNNNQLSLIVNANGTPQLWAFGADGSLSIPGNPIPFWNGSNNFALTPGGQGFQIDFSTSEFSFSAGDGLSYFDYINGHITYTTDSGAGITFNTLTSNTGWTIAQGAGSTPQTLSISGPGGSWNFGIDGGLTLPNLATEPGTPVEGEMIYQSTSHQLEVWNGTTWTTMGGGGGTPAGANTQIQYNNSGAFGADSGMTYDNVNVSIHLNDGSPSVMFNDATGATEYAIVQANSSGLFLSATQPSEYVQINTNSGAFVWTFDGGGTLTAPGGAIFNMPTSNAALTDHNLSLQADDNFNLVFNNAAGTATWANLVGASDYSLRLTGNNDLMKWNLIDGWVSIGVNDLSRDPSALFQLNSVDHGFLLPRMTTTQRNAIASPATGLMIYNTDTNAQEYWNGTTWKFVASTETLTTVTTTYTAAADAVIQADATAGAFTITLPASASSTNLKYTIKKIDSSVNVVTIQGNAAETIDGSNTQLLNVQWSSMTVFCNGTSWIII